MMQKQVYILFSFFVLLCTLPFHRHAIDVRKTVSYSISDTVIEDVIKEDELIDEVVKTRAVPKKEKVRYFSQVTKYGFRNLFSNYNYNATMPYTAQVNPRAELFVQDYMRSHGNYLTGMKNWGLPYFNLIEGVLQQYGLPKELKYVAVIESNLKSGAISNKGAVGPWQLMPWTARNLGLNVNLKIDERTDYYKSTHAASRYLLKLYGQLHDWLLVMAAYNGGLGRVNDAIKKSGSKNFWDLQYFLPEESRTYVKRFIATHYIMEGTGGVTTTTNAVGNYDSENVTRTNYGESIKPASNPYNNNATLSNNEMEEVETLSVSGKYNSLVMCKNLSMNIAEFAHYNPNFDNKISSFGSYDLKLPSDKMKLFVANKYTILNESVQVLLSGASAPAAVTTTVYPTSKQKKKKSKTLVFAKK